MDQPTTLQTVPVVGGRPGLEVELIPGRRFLTLSPKDIPPIGVAELVPAGDGTFRPVARICPSWFTLTPENLAKLDIAISVRGFHRLITAGFVDGVLVTPGVTQFDYFSYRQHLEKVRDPEFWDKIEAGHRFTNRQRYRQAL